MTRAWLGAILATCTTVSVSTSLAAQIPVVLASITTDTGAMAPGRHNFSTYTEPGMCLAAAINTRDAIRMRFAAARSYDTLRWQPMHDTLPSVAAQVARGCMTRFTVANTPPAELENLFDLALLAQNDSMAQMVLAKRIQIAPSDSVRRAIRAQALLQYFGLLGGGGFGIRSEPARPSLADAVMAEIDQLDPTKPDNLSARIDAQEFALTFAAKIHDSERIRRAIAAIDTLVHQTTLTQNEAANAMSAHWDGYQALMQLASREGADSIQRVVERAQRDLQTLPPALKSCAGWGDGCHTFSADTIRTKLLATVPGEGHAALATKLPLSMRYWFPQTPFSKTPTIPLPNTVTLVIQPGPACLLDADFLRYFAFCHDQFDAVRRWIGAYGTRGLAIVFVAELRGHATYSGLMTPDQEAAYLRWYFQDFEQLPVTVAVQTPSVRTLADGRRLQDLTGDGLLNLDAMTGGLVVFSRNGTQIWGHPFTSINNYTDDTDAIQAALTAPPPPTIH